jgi:hypothetical protein
MQQQQVLGMLLQVHVGHVPGGLAVPTCMVGWHFEGAAVWQG